MTDSYAAQASQLLSGSWSDPVPSETPAPAAPATTPSPARAPTLSDRAIADAEIAYALAEGRPTPASSLRAEFRAKQAELEQVPVFERTREQREALLQLTRGEVAGSPEPLGPPNEPDLDVPLNVDGYEIPGGVVTNAEMWALAERWRGTAFENGIGKQKAYDAILWAGSSPNFSAAEFQRLAVYAGWPDEHIKAGLRMFK